MAQATREHRPLLCPLLDGCTSWSPDLNPIENLYRLMKKCIAAVGVNTLQDLAEVVMALWDSIAPGDVALIQSMPDRLLATVKANDWHNG
jgi:hypothetical protein